MVSATAGILRGILGGRGTVAVVAARSLNSICGAAVAARALVRARRPFFVLFLPQREMECPGGAIVVGASCAGWGSNAASNVTLDGTEDAVAFYYNNLLGAGADVADCAWLAAVTGSAAELVALAERGGQVERVDDIRLLGRSLLPLRLSLRLFEPLAELLPAEQLEQVSIRVFADTGISPAAVYTQLPEADKVRVREALFSEALRAGVPFGDVETAVEPCCYIRGLGVFADELARVVLVAVAKGAEHLALAALLGDRKAAARVIAPSGCAI